MKKMKNNLKGYIKKTMEQNVQKINETMEKIFKQQKKLENEMEEIKASQIFLNKEFEELKINVDKINSINVDATLQNTNKKLIELKNNLKKKKFLKIN